MAAITATERKPTRIKSCSASTLAPSFTMLFATVRVGRSRSFQIYTRLIKLPFRQAATMLITQPTALPITVAMAAPFTPSSGKPKFPPIKR